MCVALESLGTQTEKQRAKVRRGGSSRGRFDSERGKRCNVRLTWMRRDDVQESINLLRGADFHV